MNIYLRKEFFIGIAVCIISFLLSYSFPIMYAISWYLLYFFILLNIIDFYILYRAAKLVSLHRSVKEKLSLGDPQFVEYNITNNNKINLDYELTDELPMQLQHRKYINLGTIEKNDIAEIRYKIRPTVRGQYQFGKLNAYISNKYIGMLQRRITEDCEEQIAVYPSFIQMKKYELQVFSQTASLSGIRRVRQIGENDEFEHIRNYVQGDNIRSINWRATSRKGELMVNQYENSKSQMVYSIIDKGRSMKMPFEGMTLLDHAINSSLVLSNIVLKKYDNAGLITFSDKIGAIIKASSQQNHLQKISGHLYNQKTGFKESNFELLFHTLRSQVSRRSVILFFTNFEQPDDLRRNLKYLKAVNRKHLLVVIIFKNTELESAKNMKTTKLKDIYFKTFTRKAILEKEKIADTLRANGIQTILTAPEDLSVNVVNKYLEIKAKRLK